MVLISFKRNINKIEKMYFYNYIINKKKSVKKVADR